MERRGPVEDGIAGWWKLWMGSLEAWSKPGEGDPQRPMDAWQSLIESWNRAMAEAMEQTATVSAPMAGTMAGLFDAMELLGEFGKLWSDALARAKTEGPSAWAAFFESEGLERVRSLWRDKVAQVANLWAAQPFGSQRPVAWLMVLLQMQDAAGGTMGKLTMPWIDSLNELSEAWSAALRGDGEAFSRFSKRWQEVYAKTFGRMLRAPAMGFAREYTQRLARSMDAYVAYLADLQEFVGVIEQVGSDAARRWAAAVASLGGGEGMATHKEIYRAWIDVFETTYKDLFSTEEYARLQGRVVTSAMRYKQRLDRTIEDLLQWVPVPTDSEMAELYESFHELKRQVRVLERRVEELSENLAERGKEGE